MALKGVSEATSSSVRVFDTYGISEANLLLTLGNFGPNKWWHYKPLALQEVDLHLGQFNIENAKEVLETSITHKE